MDNPQILDRIEIESTRRRRNKRHRRRNIRGREVRISITFSMHSFYVFLSLYMSNSCLDFSFFWALVESLIIGPVQYGRFITLPSPLKSTLSSRLKLR
jgi:hypothetical protein